MDVVVDGVRKGWLPRAWAFDLIVRWLGRAWASNYIIEHPAPLVWNAISIDGGQDTSVQLVEIEDLDEFSFII